jgi:hypothetical protein
MFRIYLANVAIELHYKSNFTIMKVAQPTLVDDDVWF